MFCSSSSCTDSLQVLPGSPSGTSPTSSNGTCDVSNVKFEGDLDMQGEEELNVKTEEEECIDINQEDGIYIEEEGEEDIDTTEDDVDVKEESCTDPLQVLPCSSSETFPTPSDGACDVNNTAVQQDVVVVEEHFIAVSKEAPIGIKQEEIPEDISFPDIKAEPDESFTVSLQVLPGSSSETFPTPSDGTCDVSNTAVQQDLVVVEELFMAVNEVAPTGIKQEQIPEDISFPDIKTEPNENCVDLRSGELGSCAASSGVGNVIRVQVEGISDATEEENQEPITSSLIRTDPGFTGVLTRSCMESLICLGYSTGRKNELDPQELVQVKVEPDIEVKCEDQKADADIEENFGDKNADVDRDSSQDFSSHYAEAGFGNSSSEWAHKCAECGKSFPTCAGVQKHSYKDKPKTCSCDICGQSFYHPNLLKTHRLVHTDGKPYLCEICGRRFLQASNLRLHSVKHKGEKSHECKMCKKRFFNADALKTHCMIHSGIRPHVCEVCNRRFTQAGNLKTHMLVHTKEKPFQCTECGKGFALRHALKSHQTLHTGEKPYKCNVCSKEFRHRQALISHQKIHTGDKPYECDICLKRFSLRGNLQKHIVIHMSEKPYNCTFCSKRYSDTQSLKEHVASHVNNKHYKCGECNKQFPNLEALEKHSDDHKGEIVVGF